MCVCVCARARARVRACVRACVCVRAFLFSLTHAHANSPVAMATAIVSEWAAKKNKSAGLPPATPVTNSQKLSSPSTPQPRTPSTEGSPRRAQQFPHTVASNPSTPRVANTQNSSKDARATAQDAQSTPDAGAGAFGGAGLTPRGALTEGEKSGENGRRRWLAENRIGQSPRSPPTPIRPPDLASTPRMTVGGGVDEAYPQSPQSSPRGVRKAGGGGAVLGAPGQAGDAVERDSMYYELR